mmetsp:Transcript_51893/g.105541  ORF Transcript_51893/g.105541 Transcript_51893/m.105541 type:complete len:115 (+) Transcript_51893:713-1057(+)
MTGADVSSITGCDLDVVAKLVPTRPRRCTPVLSGGTWMPSSKSKVASPCSNCTYSTVTKKNGTQIGLHCGGPFLVASSTEKELTIVSSSEVMSLLIAKGFPIGADGYFDPGYIN